VSNNGALSAVGEHGIHFIEPSTYNTIKNSVINNNDGDGIYLEHCHYNVIVDNIIYQNQVSATGDRIVRSIGHGVFLNPSIGNTIEHNEVYANGEAGIALYQSNDTQIINNYSHDNVKNGIQLQYSHYNTVDQNIITANGGSESKTGSRIVRSIGHGVFLNPSTHNTITNNVIFDNNGDGCYLYHSHENLISHNSIYNNDADAEMGVSRIVRSIGHGVFLNPSLGNTIEFNDVYGNGEAGIGIIYSNYTTIENNYVHENKHNGVQLQYSNWNLVNLNIIGNNGGVESKDGARIVRSIGHGVFLNPSTHNTISNNEIFNNYGDGCYLYHSHENLIERNSIHNNDADAEMGVTRIVRSIGHGVFLNPSNGNTIRDNEVYSNGDSGIGLIFCNYTNIDNNYVHENSGNGVQLQHSNENLVGNNLILQNGAVDSSARIVRSIGHGVFLNPSVGNKILNNTISANSGNGVELLLTNDTTMISNTISDNLLYGVNLTLGSEDNLIGLNNFNNNNPSGTSQAINNGDENTFVYNHWSDHSTADEDGNGIADVPYAIDGSSESEDIAGLTSEITETGHYLMAPIILFPSYLDKVSVTVTVSWLPALDSYGQSVTYDFWYSPDAGKTWILGASDLTTCYYEWDISSFKSGSRYMIRIVATNEDGLTAEDESGKFEIFKIKKTTFENTDEGVLGLNNFATITSAMISETTPALSFVTVLLSISSVILYNRYRKNSRK
jgi:parallel beta-helix repeat protein